MAARKPPPNLNTATDGIDQALRLLSEAATSLTTFCSVALQV